MRHLLIRLLISWFALALLSACSPSPEAALPATQAEASAEATEASAIGDTQHPAAQAVISYLQARVSADADAMRQLTCAEQEAQVATLALSFEGREAQLLETSCGYAEEGRVVCQGSISASYQGEARSFALPNYRVVQEDGQWRVCGEAH